MNHRKTIHIERVESVQDLAARVDAADQRVVGGFDPQPDPPKESAPIVRLPIRTIYLSY